jgi:hypothetical protein
MKRRYFNCIISFQAANFYPHLASTFLMKLVHKVFIECYSVIQVLPDILREEEGLGAHASVLLFAPTFGIRYFWCHPDIRPLGETLPLQCPSCSVLRSVRFELGLTSPGSLEVFCHCGWSESTTLPEGDVVLPSAVGKKIIGWGNSMIYGTRAELQEARNAPRDM